MPTASANAAQITSETDNLRPVRIFAGVKVVPEIASELSGLAVGLKAIAVRPVAAVDIHLTLVPPWDEVLPIRAIAKLRLVASQCRAFSLTIRHVGYGPQPKRPRLLWAECATGDEIVALRTALLDAYGQSDERPFRPHITIARIRGNGAAIARKHPIDRELSLTQRVETVELFQSPPSGERGYRILSSSRLGEAVRSALTT